ncbi:neurotrypsin-like isoform X2 [Clavelina lepadiformis]|uniref:neurotrypsin-like isoform X2 n=1 Tax=Clavelina lepadiformis TaxID=159417 RepID=UPI004042FB5A
MFYRIPTLSCIIVVLISAENSGESLNNTDTANKTRMNSGRSSGTLLNIFVNGKPILPQRPLPIKLNQVKPKPVSPLTSLLSTAKPSWRNNPFAEFGRFAAFNFYTSSRSEMDTSNALRTYLFNPLYESNNSGVKLAGSYLPYMGRVQVSLPGNQWGSICGVGWDVKDATVVCRQLGFQIGGVIPRPRMEFGRPIGQVVMSKVNCRGNEASLDECEAERWDGENSLPCPKELSAAGLVCGCTLDVSQNVLSRCSLYTSFPFDSLSCFHSCLPNQVLVGDKHRYCSRMQKWTGKKPQCIETDSPCTKNPCKSKGICQDYFGDTSLYECSCFDPYGGKNCQFRRDWSCGRQRIKPDLRHVKPELRIAGGKSAINGSWPWIVQLRDNDTQFCSGSLISPQWVLTAAHCLHLRSIGNGPNNNTRWTIVSGQHSRDGHDYTNQVTRIDYVLANNFTNIDIPRKDIALIKLKSPIRVDSYTELICLPSVKSENPEDGSKCWIAGWGESIFPEETSSYLQQGDIPVVSADRCRQIGDQLDMTRDYRLIEDMICAGYKNGGVDACDGDSGGPLMCPRKDGSWYLAGIVSWGYSCAGPNMPGVYTKVSHYLDWIYDALQNI